MKTKITIAVLSIVAVISLGALTFRKAPEQGKVIAPSHGISMTDRNQFD